MHLCTIVPISKAVGANRIYPSVSIPNPTGYPDLNYEHEVKARLELTKKSLEALTADIKEQTIFN